jgi:hypothetical protein
VQSKEHKNEYLTRVLKVNIIYINAQNHVLFFFSLCIFFLFNLFSNGPWSLTCDTELLLYHFSMRNLEMLNKCPIHKHTEKYKVSHKDHPYCLQQGHQSKKYRDFEIGIKLNLCIFTRACSSAKLCPLGMISIVSNNIIFYRMLRRTNSKGKSVNAPSVVYHRYNETMGGM